MKLWLVPLIYITIKILRQHASQDRFIDEKRKIVYGVLNLLFNWTYI